MKILHIGLMVNKKLNVGLSKAFRDIADEYEEYELCSDLRQQLTGCSFSPNIVFVQVQNEKIHNQNTNIVLNECMDLFRDKGAFIINWTGDKRDSIPSWMNGFKADLTCFSNWDDVNNFRGKSDFLQIGIDPINFNKDHDAEDLTAQIPVNIPEIVFMGNNAGNFPLSNERLSMVKFLQKQYGNRFGVFGNGYPNSLGSINATPDNPFHMQSLESYIYSKCKIAINYSHYNSDGYFSDRLLRAMGSGSFVLSHDYKGISNQWELGVDLQKFTSLQDLQSKINYYLENETERKQIATNGYRNVHMNHTYLDMAQNIIDLYYKHKTK